MKQRSVSRRTLSQTLQSDRACRTLGLLSTPLLGMLALGCQSDGVQNDESVAVSVSRLSPAATRVLGFESNSDWLGSTANSATHSEGTKSVSVTTTGWSELKSIALSSLGAVGSQLSVDVMLPATTPYWGQVSVAVEIPSKGIWNQPLGAQSTVGLSANTFHTLSFSIPSDISAALSSTYADLSFRVVINAPAGNYLVDHLVVAPGTTPDPFTDAQKFVSVDMALDGLSSAYEAYGASAALAIGGNLVRQRTTGCANDITSGAVCVPITPSHLLRVGSVSKVITNTAIQKLAETFQNTTGQNLYQTQVFGPLGLLPQYGATAPADPTAPNPLNMVVEDLLYHVSGFDGDISYNCGVIPDIATAFGKALPVSMDDVVNYALHNVGLQYEPGTVYDYYSTSVGHIVLAKIVDAVMAPQSYAAYTDAVLFDPYAIHNIRPGHTQQIDSYPDEVFYFNTSTRPSVVVPGQPVVSNPYGRCSIENMVASGGWVATPTDLTRFMDNVFENGLLSEAQIGDITTPHSYKSEIDMKNGDQVVSSDMDDHTMGWGYESDPATGLARFSKSGAYDSTSAFIFHRRDQNLSWAIATNSSVSSHTVNNLGYVALKGPHGTFTGDASPLFRIHSNFGLRASANVEYFAVYGTQEVYLNDRAQCVANRWGARCNVGAGSVGVNGYVNLGVSTKVTNVISSGNILLRAAKVDHKAVAGGSVTKQAGTTVGESVLQYYPYDSGYLETSVTAANVVSGPNDVTLPAGGNLTLAAGKYRNLNCAGANTLTLEKGIYYFHEMNVEPNVTFRIKPTAAGDDQPTTIRIFVDNNIALKSGFKVEFEDPDADNAGTLLLASTAGTSVYLARNTKWRGTVIAPTADVNVERNDTSNLEGAFIGRKVTLQPDTKLKHVPFRYWNM